MKEGKLEHKLGKTNVNVQLSARISVSSHTAGQRLHGNVLTKCGCLDLWTGLIN